MSKGDPIVVVKDVHKSFVLPQSKNRFVKQAFVNIFQRQKPVMQHALKGVTFTVNEGDFFGIVGRNGSGKSTLLKMLAGVYQPTSGVIEIYGALTPFIELGVGFNPELSGRDNVYLNGALLGFSRAQMDEMYDDIVEFAELEQFMGQKLKNYSSGMQVRLAFSIAIKARNKVLIFDEVLAVGDEAFQKKCYNIFDQYKAEGQTVILVSHDMQAIRNFCNRAVLIDGGVVVDEGSPDTVATSYSLLNQESIDQSTATANEARRSSQKAKYLKVDVKPVAGGKIENLKLGSSLLVDINVKGLQPEAYESVGVTFVRQSGEHVGGLNSRVLGDKGLWKKKGHIQLEAVMDFAPGTYYPYIELFSKPGERLEDYMGPTFEIRAKDLPWSGLTKINAKWNAKNG